MKQLAITIFSTFFAVSAIFAQGKVGVNTTTPQATLDVKSDANSRKAIRMTDPSGTEAISVLNNGNVGINVTDPDTRLHVKSIALGKAFRMEDGTEGEGKVLTSDVNGRATWQNKGLQAPQGSYVWNAGTAAGTPDANGTKVYGPYTVPKTGYYMLKSRWFYTQNVNPATGGDASVGAAGFWLQINENPNNQMDGVGLVYEFRAAVNRAVAGICPPTGAVVYLKANAPYYVHQYTYATQYSTGERNFTWSYIQ